MYRLLMVDDDPNILKINRSYFEKREFLVNTAENAEEASRLLTQSYDCILLDIRMEGTDGYRLCQEIKENTRTPVIFLTSLSEEECLERGFLSGGDDYVTKPCGLRELELRVLARIRAAFSPKEHGTLHFDNLTMNLLSRQVYLGNQLVPLTSNEFDILRLLIEHSGTPFSQEEIYHHIWKEDDHYNSHSVQTLMVRVRKKLAAIEPDQEYIKTAWGRGYLFCNRIDNRS